ncbi:sugar MFS transporter [Chryseolinea sp. H1M3-3]|uniref:sugar MFS transporter n=1 Tax=Chryseolinea sp. H1M3-3 TaxID=3034144 RepID=UPI0023EAC781|nr:sugar MFS transporter [Chryseolinea sp. H1M3-3]
MNTQQKSYVLPMIIIGALFFIFGFVTWLNSVLIPFLKQACQLTDFQAYFVTLAFYISYFVMAIPSSIILRKIGFAKGMSVGLAVMAIGALVFIPAAQVRSYPLFLVGLFMQATGMTLLQTASNPYVTILGPIESAAKRISIMGISNKVAGMIGIFILVELLFSDTQTLSEKIASLSGAELENELDILASRVIVPYIVMAIVLGGLALLILKAHLPEINPEEEVSPAAASHLKEKKSVFDFPHLVLGVVCIFVYVGVEVIAIDTIGLYGEYQGFDLSTASKFGIYSLIALTVGYLLQIAVIPKYLSQRMALMLSAVMGFVCIIAAMLTSGWVSIGFIVLLSFANSFMWPSIWPLALNSLGQFTKVGSALLIMGVVGGALIPLIYGALADSSNRQMAYWIALPCYLFIVFYATKGYKAGKV